MNEEHNPGEARTRQRQRRQIIYMLVAGIAGGSIGFFSGFFGEGDGSLFTGDLDNFSLPPTVSIGLSVALFAAIIGLPLWGFTQIDDYKREQNFIGFTGGCLAVLAGFPIWAALHAGGLARAPDAVGIFALAMIAMIASVLYAKWRI